MRRPLLGFMMIALLASTMTAASAFNWAQTGARTVSATIVDDNLAYLAIEKAGNHDCYIDYNTATTGKIDIIWDGGDTCGAAGTGINPNSKYYYTDMIKVTNKGKVILPNIWVNLTSSTGITIKGATAATTMAADDTGTWSAAYTTTTLGIGSSVWIGFRIDASTIEKNEAHPSGTLTVEARTTT